MSSVRDLLSKLDLGRSVAEFDVDLQKYFVETNAFRQLISDKYDIIAGDKGTGKTAIFRILSDSQASYENLAGIQIIQAFNPQGNPIFQSLAEREALEEGDYILLWKSYILGVVGNYIISNDSRLAGSELDLMISALGLKTADVTPKGVFRKIMDSIPNFFRWESAEVDFTLSETGVPVVTPRVKFDAEKVDENVGKRVVVEDAFRLLNNVLAERDLKVWVALDRLDEAFQGYPDVEIRALRALLRTYLDLTEFDRIKLKLFLRRDLFRRVTSGGFVNLSHVNNKKLEIIWDEEDLLNLLCRRIRENSAFVEMLGASELNDNDLFARIFPDQVDPGERKPVTWTWIMGRIRDGNDVKPPRNLIDLVNFSQAAQARKEEREKRELCDYPIIELESLRKGLSQLSETRVGDTLLAEAGTYSPLIEKFRESKAEHNVDTLSKILGVDSEQVRSFVKPLVEIGFLEEVGQTYKIPMIYRDGLEITQGKAF